NRIRRHSTIGYRSPERRPNQSADGSELVSPRLPGHHGGLDGKTLLMEAASRQGRRPSQPRFHNSPSESCAGVERRTEALGGCMRGPTTARRPPPYFEAPASSTISAVGASRLTASIPFRQLSLDL